VPVPALALSKLRGLLAGEVDTDPEHLAAQAPDASAAPGTPEAIVRPAGPEDLVAVVGWARAEQCPLVARGAGTSLDGESVASRGGVLLDLAGWNAILELDVAEGLARVQPGVVNRALDRQAVAQGWSYPVNPGSWESSTLGGNVATNASGPRSLRHGPTRNWVLSLRVVDGRGRRWTAGGRYRKASVGPDLVSLLVGSEGTLAIFEEITLRLRPTPERPIGRFALELRALLGPSLAALEYLDPTVASTLTELRTGAGPGTTGLVLVEVEGSAEDEAQTLHRLERGRTALGITDDPGVYPDADRLWSLRGKAGPALDRALGPRVREDVSVPLPRLDELLALVRQLAGRHRIQAAVFGHLGEGNLHPVFGIDPSSAEATELREELLDGTLGLGGSISGEHGVGVTKRSRLRRQLGDPGIDTLRALKASLDPDGILNPGKLLPDL
jgi:D-lactate dehydrogenase